MILNNIRLCLIRYQYLLSIDRKYLKIFSTPIQLNLTMKNLIISRKYKEVLDLFDQQISLRTDITFNLALKAATKLLNCNRGIHIHQQVPSRLLLENSFIQTALINFYMECHLIDDANRIFSTIKKKNIFLYTAMLKGYNEIFFKKFVLIILLFLGYINNNLPEKAIKLYEEIPKDEVDEIIITLLFNACTKLSNDYSIKIGKDVLNQLPKSFLRDQQLIDTIIQMLMKFGHVKDVEYYFEKSPQKTIVTYAVMMQGYAKNNFFEKALDLFEENSLKLDAIMYIIIYNICTSLSNQRSIQLGKTIIDKMPKEFLNNTNVVTSLMHMLMNFGQVEKAESFFEQIKNPTLYTYGVLMNGYKNNDQPEKCLTLFEEMKKQNIIIDEPIALALIGACSLTGIRSISQNIAQQISHLKLNLRLKTSLINMWSKSGDINRAKEIFQSIHESDTLVYGSMINGYGLNGMSYEAIDIYEQMPENMKNEMTHICILNACSHSGLVNQAQVIFNKILIKTTNIITTMVDCYSRMGLFDEAQEIIMNYEKSNPPYLIMYMAMLSGARNHRQIDLSKKFYDQMKNLFPNQKSDLIAASILLSNTYSSLGEDQQAKQVRIKQIGKNIKIGLSWTEVNGEVMCFKAHDRSHPQSNEIYAELDHLSNQLKENGYEYDSSWITRPLKDGETYESVLCGHSEKLAIVFNLIQKPQPSLIQITKNLRICGDCHRATKMIAKIRQCTIIVRDANRIHHFHTNGQCSCQDYF
ncbi:unnamed protein product [Adineta steineri]|uniref:DYW domain-containing protein n=1 Tax=Adineta steineri TaxID=433720 RepID=A0A815GPW3_9BILA|nr:unnamed protein product [Adineta steineri]